MQNSIIGSINQPVFNSFKENANNMALKSQNFNQGTKDNATPVIGMKNNLNQPYEDEFINNKYEYNNNEENTDGPKDKKLRKILIGTGVGIITVAGAVVAGKKGLLGSKIQSFLGGKNVMKADNLGYEIPAPKIDDIAPNLDTVARFGQDYPLEIEYQKISDDIQRNPNAQRRFNEVVSNLRNTASEINQKFKEVLPDGEDFEGGVIERAILQKRYFSIPENKTENYCCLDPLLHRQAREEALDIQTGYHILEPLQSGGKENPLLNALRGKYQGISKEDNSFIDTCVQKLADDDALCCGHNSKLHAHELSRVGKIFREAMGIAVQ